MTAGKYPEVNKQKTNNPLLLPVPAADFPLQSIQGLSSTPTSQTKPVHVRGTAKLKTHTEENHLKKKKLFLVSKSRFWAELSCDKQAATGDTCQSIQHALNILLSEP